MTRRRNYRNQILSVVFIFAAISSFFFIKNLNQTQNTNAYSLDNFDPGFIISDYVMGDYNSMTEQEIQDFLTSKNSCSNTNYEYYEYLSSNPKYKWHWKDGHFVCLSEELFGDGEIIGEGDTAAHIIWQAAQDFQINPKVLIVLLEKETSLITDRIPNDGDYRKATGYGCPDTAACSEKYYGFKNQVRSAASLFHTVLSGGWTNYPLGVNYIQYNPNKDCGGSEVNIRSLATSALYRYTPYQPNEGALAAGYGTTYCGAYGNRNFYLYYGDWFGDPQASPSIKPTILDISQNKNTDVITIKWEKAQHAASNILGYDIVIADTNKKEYRYLVASDKTSFTFDKLPAGNYFAAAVIASNGQKEEYDRVVFDFHVADIPNKPEEITVESEGDTIKMNWKKPAEDSSAPILNYVAEVTNTFGVVYKMETTELSATFNDLPAGVYKSFKVTAVNKMGKNTNEATKNIITILDCLDEGEPYEDFKDMPQDQTSKTAVSWAVNNGITDKNEYFNGETALTRRQAMVLLWRFISLSYEKEI